MKQYLTLLSAGAMLLFCLGAVGCGTTTGNSTSSTTRSTTAETTAKTEASTTESKTEAPATTPPTETSEMTLPDLDTSMGDVEPNIPESGVGGMTESGISDLLPHDGARGGSRGGTNAPSPALPSR